MDFDGDAIHRQLDEASILADIAYFESKLAELVSPETDESRAMHRVHLSLLVHRRRLLAAWRDGQPERWSEYEHVA